MKKIVLLLLVSFLFFSCKWYKADLIEYLDYYSNSAAIEYYKLDGSYPSTGGITNIPGGTAKNISFIMRNPKKYDLNFGITWHNSPLGQTQPVYGVDYTFNQEPYDTLVMTLTEAFLDKLDSNPTYGDISATISLQDSFSGRNFETYSYNLIANSPPTTPQGAVFLKHSDLHTWILSFNLSTTELRKAKDNDIRTVTLNNTGHSVNIDHTDGSFTVSGSLTTDESLVKQGKNITLEDAIGQRYFHGENTVYYVTDIPTSQSPTASLSFTDSRGLTSEMATVSTNGLVKTQYYVSESGSDSNTASISSPYKTLQKAIDTILASNDANKTYVIYTKGNVGSGTIAPTNSDVHNIRIEGYDSGAIIDTLSIKGSETRIHISSDIEITNATITDGSTATITDSSVQKMVVSNNSNIHIDDVNLTELEYTSTNVSVSFASKPANPIKITVPANTVNNTLLVKGSGANLAESDFTLNASSGSVYVADSNLYYSTHKQVVWTNVTSKATEAAQKAKAKIPSFTIGSNFTVPIQAVAFHESDTNNADKEKAIKNSLIEAFAGASYPVGVQPLTADDIRVNLSLSSAYIRFRVSSGYAFERTNVETEKTLYITLSGDFESLEQVNWKSITTEAIASATDGRSSLPQITISEAGSVTTGNATVSFVNSAIPSGENKEKAVKQALMFAINKKLPTGIAALTENDISLTVNSANARQASVTITLKAVEGYLIRLNDKNDTSVAISLTVVSPVDFGDITMLDASTIRMGTPSGDNMAFTGTWTVDNMSFNGNNSTSKLTITAGSTITNSQLATAIKDAINAPTGITVTVEPNNDTVVTPLDKTFSATLSVQTGYLFTDLAEEKKIENISFNVEQKTTLEGITGNAITGNATFAQLSSGSSVGVTFTATDNATKVANLETALVSSFNENLQERGFNAINESNINIAVTEATYESTTITLSGITVNTAAGYTLQEGSPNTITFTLNGNFKTRVDISLSGSIEKNTNIAGINNLSISSGSSKATVTSFDSVSATSVEAEKAAIQNAIAEIFNAKNPTGTNDINASNVSVMVNSHTEAIATFTLSVISKAYELSSSNAITLALDGILSLHYYVSETSTSDSGKTGFGTSNAFASVQAAVNAVQTKNNTSAGTHHFSIVVQGTIANTSLSTANGMVDITSTNALNLTIKGESAGAIIDAGARFTVDSSTGFITIKERGLENRVLYISGTNTNVTLQDLTITGGLAQGTNGDDGYDGASAPANSGKEGGSAYGGGLYVKSGTVTVDNTTVSYNNAIGGSGGDGGDGISSYGSSLNGGSGGFGGFAAGGGLYVESGTVSIKNKSVLSNNNAVGGAGGNGGRGIYDWPNVGSGGDGGNGRVADGGGMYVKNGTITIDDTTLSNNTVISGLGGSGGSDVYGGGDVGGVYGYVMRGGGLYIFNGEISITNSTLSNNTVIGGDGVESTIYNDGTSAHGGGIAIVGGDVSISGSEFSSNKAAGGHGHSPMLGSFSTAGDGGVAYGGGVYIGGGTVSITDTKVNSNDAVGAYGGVSSSGASNQGSPGYPYGGGIYVESKYSTTSFSDISYSGNTLHISGTIVSDGDNGIDIFLNN